ncbi:MAG TPA: hypothetical protein VFS22_00470 [Flavisolibacter sp.]|nr:hypothetical protein [Flavisolibacter sp.]
MSEQNQHLESIEDIKRLMHKSSRFISLSGLSGVAAGVCALIASWIAYRKIQQAGNGGHESLETQLVMIGAVTFIAALVLAFLFTYVRSRQTGVAIWGYTARRVMINVFVPMLAGGLVIWRMIGFGYYNLVAPVSLIFYGLALINASKFTLNEIRYLGYGQLLLGLLNLWLEGYGLYFWAMGFGVLHILYGLIMWNKYERNY